MSKASYIGKEPTYGVFISQAETGDGSTVAFSLDATAATTASLLVSVGGVIQQPGSAFNLNAAGTTLTFSAAPASSVPIWLLFLGQTLTVPTAAAVTSAVVNGEAALGSAPSAADTFLLYDDSAAALKKVTYANLIPTTHGDVSGPGSSTDDALAKFDSTTGKIIQNSTATLTDAGVLTSTTFVGNLTGNASGTAATVTGATQSAITAVGTIASLVATTADINGGTFDGIVGGTTPAAITGTQVDITAQGDLRLQDTTGGQYVAIQAPGTVSTSYTLTMPGDDGDADEFLQTNGSGVLTWADALPSQTGNAGETLITDATDASWAPRSGKNYLINGNFDVWQRGTSFAAMSQSYTNYQADRWQITPSGNSAVMTVSRQAFTAGQTDVPNNPLYFCRCDVTTAASSSASGEVTNKIEDVNTLSGKPVVLSFWAKTVSGTTTLTLRLKQNFGSGGSGDAYTALGTANLTTTWTKFTLTATCASVSGKTIGTGSYLGLNWYWNNNSTTTDDIDIAQFQLEEGTVPTLFEYKTVGQTLAACQRFFCKSFPQGTEPANGNGVVNGAMLGKGVTTDDTEPFMSWQYPVIMRAAPSIVLYNHRSGGTAGQWDNHGSASSSGARVIFSSDFCVRIDNGDTKLAAANAWMIHATATAEL